MAKEHSAVRAALINRKGAIIAALIVGGVSTIAIFLKPATPAHNSATASGSDVNNSGVIGNANSVTQNQTTQNTTSNTGQNQNAFFASGGPVNITQYFTYNNGTNAADNSVKDLITALEAKTQTNSTDIQITRSEVQTITKLLTKLDERTSDMERLPDGRTRFGGSISGQPIVVVKALDQGFEAYLRKDFQTLFSVTEVGIAALEGSLRPNIFYEETRINPNGIAALYYLGSSGASRQGKHILALKYAEKAYAAVPDYPAQFLLAGSLFNLGEEEREHGNPIGALALYQQAITNCDSYTLNSPISVFRTNLIELYSKAAFVATQLGSNDLVKTYSAKTMYWVSLK